MSDVNGAWESILLVNSKKDHKPCVWWSLSVNWAGFVRKYWQGTASRQRSVHPDIHSDARLLFSGTSSLIAKLINLQLTANW